ncbi:peptidase C1A [Kipferlia bialata]|uniref:Peptidase C1A n=1 Tax=Kipferlia bialata TaxID=797122 RepID=A0A9K3GNN9_9EUKA|nr:peptidase C1A [Kipferlia bialata]|eukprot:g12116.t1
MRPPGLLWLVIALAVAAVSVCAAECGGSGWEGEKYVLKDTLDDTDPYAYNGRGHVEPGLLETVSFKQKTVPAHVKETLPTSYSMRTEYPECMTPMLNQGSCGSCWAFMAVRVARDSMCMRYMGHESVDDLLLSPQDMLSCSGRVCSNGGNMYYANLYLTNTVSIYYTYIGY